MAEPRLTPFDKITIRCISLEGTPQKVKFMFPAIANNKQLLKNVGFVISDPNYDAKMEAIKMKKPFSENGITNEPVKESFTPQIEPTKTAPLVTQPKNESTTQTINIPNEIEAPAIANEPKKRIRRTKAQIEADKLTASKQTA